MRLVLRVYDGAGRRAKRGGERVCRCRLEVARLWVAPQLAAVASGPPYLLGPALVVLGGPHLAKTAPPTPQQLSAQEAATL